MISPTTKDLTRSIDFLDTHASGHPDFTEIEMIASVAKNLLFTLRNGGMKRHEITNKMIALVMLTHGATPFTVEQYARKIGTEIRRGSTGIAFGSW